MEELKNNLKDNFKLIQFTTNIEGKQYVKEKLTCKICNSTFSTGILMQQSTMKMIIQVLH